MGNLDNRSSKALKLFFIIMISLSIVWETAIIYFKAMGLTVFLMWVPAFAAFVVESRYFKEEKGFLGFRRCKVKYILWAFLLPLIYIGVPYIIYWLIFPGTLVKVIDIRFFVILVIGIPIGMLTSTGEEIGWRGFMVPSLFKKIGLEKTLLLSSLIWGVKKRLAGSSDACCTQ